MAYHIKKSSLVNSSVTVYYVGDSRWSDDFSERKQYSDDPSAMFVNNDGKNGGWYGASAVRE